MIVINHRPQYKNVQELVKVNPTSKRPNVQRPWPAVGITLKNI